LWRIPLQFVIAVFIRYFSNGGGGKDPNSLKAIGEFGGQHYGAADGIVSKDQSHERKFQARRWGAHPDQVPASQRRTTANG